MLEGAEASPNWRSDFAAADFGAELRSSRVGTGRPGVRRIAVTEVLPAKGSTPVERVLLVRARLTAAQAWNTAEGYQHELDRKACHIAW